MRRNPRNIEYKAKLRPSDSFEASKDGIDLTYFNQRRARMLNNLGRAIAKKEINVDVRKVGPILSATVQDEIECEFGATFEDMLEMAYYDTPNKVSLITELEAIRYKLGRVPRKEEMEELSKFDISQYGEEFESWERLLERRGYDPFYKDMGRDTPKDDALDLKPDAVRKEILTDTGNLETGALNNYIKDTLRMIKSSWNGAYISDLKMQLGVSQATMSEILSQVVKVEGICRKDIRHDGVLTDILFSNEQPSADIADLEKDGSSIKVTFHPISKNAKHPDANVFSIKLAKKDLDLLKRSL